MEPQFRFCTSADGTRIAYATYGRGPPLLCLPSYFSSVDAQFTRPESRTFLDALAARTLLVTFDRRGTGASARDVDDLSAEAQERDIAAVADAAGLGGFTLFAEARQLIKHLERIERLVLWQPSATPDDLRELARLARENWSHARRVCASVAHPDGPISLQRAVSKTMKESVSAETAARNWEALADADFDALAPAMTVPALILAREQFATQRQRAVRLAGLLPNGQVRFVPGSARVPYPEHEPVVEAVFEFMGLSTSVATKQPSGTAIILFLDIAGSTELTTKLGDAAYREKERQLDGSLRQAIREAGGSPVEGKVLGDGVMATFASAKDAIEAAMKCQALGEGAGVPLHAGIHAGDVTREGNNVHGGAVQVAARIADASTPGDVLVSDIVRGLARTSAGVSFDDRGEHELKGVGEPQRLWAVAAQATG